MSALGKRARDKAAEPAKRLYTPEWECMVCMDALGVDAGLVPCVITSCAPVAHLVCYSCAQDESLRNGAPCPLCRKPIGGVLPIGALVNEEADDAARQTLDRIDPSRVGGPPSVVAQARQRIEAFDEAKRKLVAQRVERIVERVEQEKRNGMLPTDVGYSWNFWWWQPPSFDTCWRMKCRERGKSYMRREQLQDFLVAEAALCNDALAQIYAGSDFKVVTSSVQRTTELPTSRTVYLRFTVTRVRAPD